METININLFTFDELSTEAKQTALNNYIAKEDFYYIWSEAKNSVKAFNELFNLRSGRNSWLEYDHNFDDNITELKGLRLRKYLINNFGYALYKGKYRKMIDGHKTIKCFSPKYWQTNEGKKHTFLYSKLFSEHTYVLTGVCYDENILDPIYNFIDNYKENANNYQYTNIIDLLDNCFESLKKAIENEIEYLQSEEAYSEHCEANEYKFLSNGQIWG